MNFQSKEPSPPSAKSQPCRKIISRCSGARDRPASETTFEPSAKGFLPIPYIDGFVFACPVANKAKLIAHAETTDALFIEYGASRIVECWEDDVPDGDATDFRRAVKAEEGEAVLFSWVEWPDKATRDKAMETMMEDPRMDPEKSPMPFDGKRMIFGGFTPVFEMTA